MGLFKEFKNFAVKGNMMDMAIGIIIGASFKTLLNVLVKKIILPPLSFLSSGVSLSDKKIILKEASEGVSEIAIQYGALMETSIDFLIIGFTLFIVIKLMNKLKDKAEDPKNVAVKTPKDIQLLSNIETLLKEQNNLLKK